MDIIPLLMHAPYILVLDLTVVLNFALDGVWIKFMDDFGERLREKSVSYSGLSKKSYLFRVAILCMIDSQLEIWLDRLCFCINLFKIVLCQYYQLYLTAQQGFFSYH